MSVKKFRLIMISAMNENGGNTLHRHFDGHPELYVYPFESQLGTRLTSDYLSSVFQHKYRWPQFELASTPEEDYIQIWDQELKTRINQPQASKFKDVDIDLSDFNRRKFFLELMKSNEKTRRNIVEAFFVSTFKAWKNYKTSGREKAYLGYSPSVVVDANKILDDFPDAKIVHIVRNPFSAYVETKARPVPLELKRYIFEWNIVQMYALSFQNLYPKNVIIVLFEDLVANPEKFFKSLCRKIGISYSEALTYPSWNGKKLEKLYPWGTILFANPDYNRKKANELTKKERQEISLLTKTFLDYFNYKKFW